MTDLKRLTALVDFDSFIWRVGSVTADEPVNYALHTAKQTLAPIYETFGDVRLFLSGKTNFRYRVATIQEYKGNRVQEKPLWFDELRQYVIDHHGATVSEGQEADDDIGIAQWAAKDRSTCIVSLDKDMRNIPGHHWHPLKQEYSYITLAEANKNFWTQVLTGDTADNIRGIPKVGPKTAAKILEGKESWVDLQQAVAQAYRNAGIENELDENAQLLWILREEGKTYDGNSIREIASNLQEG